MGRWVGFVVCKKGGRRRWAAFCLVLGLLGCGLMAPVLQHFVPLGRCVATQATVVQAGQQPLLALAPPFGPRQLLGEEAPHLQVGDTVAVFYDMQYQRVFYPPLCEPWQVMVLLAISLAIFLLPVGLLLLFLEINEKRKGGK